MSGAFQAGRRSLPHSSRNELLSGHSVCPDMQSARLTHRRSAHVVTHAVDGLKLNVDRGPNWLFVKLRPKRNFAEDVPQIADELWSIASRHFIYRLVLELDELRQMPAELVEQLVDSAGAARPVRRCAADLRPVGRVCPAHSARASSSGAADLRDASGSSARRRRRRAAREAQRDALELAATTRCSRDARRYQPSMQ